MLIKQLLFAASVIVPQLGVGSASAQTAESPYVRLAELEIDPAQIERFNASIREEIEASIRAEPGVLTLYAVSVKDDPSKIFGFSFFATSGDISSLRSTDTTATGQPAATWVEWTAPDLPGDVRFWVVLRDGRGGTAWLEKPTQVR